ncbi:hypothetical protein ES703_80067 [subsurface metagenome]
MPAADIPSEISLVLYRYPVRVNYLLVNIYPFSSAHSSFKEQIPIAARTSSYRGRFSVGFGNYRWLAPAGRLPVPEEPESWVLPCSCARVYVKLTKHISNHKIAVSLNSIAAAERHS